MRLIAVLAVLFICCPSVLFAGDWDDCNQDADLDRSIQGCSRVINTRPRIDLDIAYYNRGIAYNKKQDADRALADFTQAIRVNPKRREAYTARVTAHFGKGDIPSAMADCNEAIRLGPTVLTYLACALVDIARGDLDSARAQYDNAVSLEDNNAAAYAARAQFRAQTQKDPAGSLSDCSEAIRLNSGLPLAYYACALAYAANEDLDRSISNFDQALRLDPNYVDAYADRSFLLLFKGDFDRAISDCDDAIRLNPNHLKAHVICSDAYRFRHDHAKALRHCEKAAALSPLNPLVNTVCGAAYLAMGDADRALAEYSRAIELNDSFPGFFSNRSEAYFVKGDYDRALADCSRTLEKEPKHADAHVNCANVHRERGDYDRALAEYEEGLRLTRIKRAEYHRDRGETYHRMGDHRRAVADFDEALRIDPKLPGVGDRRRQAVASLETGGSGKPSLAASALKSEPSATAALTSPLRPAPPGKRVALVIGNGAYKTVAALPNPKNDAEAVAAALTRLGFEVMARNDLAVGDMRRALAEFEDKAAGADWGLVYYAGHGMEFDGRNWLIPVDAKLERLSDVPDETISLDRIFDRVRPAKKLRMVVLDACRNNPFLSRMITTGGRTRSVPRGLAKVEPEHGEVVFYAARDGSVAADGVGANSPFTTAFLKHLDERGLELGRFFRRVTSSVLASTSPQQEPFLYGRLPDEDFFFIPPNE